MLRPALLLVSVVLLILMPLLFGQLMFGALAKLHLSPGAATALVIAILAGSFVNIPVRRYVRDDWVPAHPLAVLGLFDALPQWRRMRRQTIIAVNLGGCVVPTGLALYELVQIAGTNGPGLWTAGIAAAINAIVCYAVARPVAGVGIVMPSLVSPLVAAAAALVLATDQAAPVAFIAGVAGPLVGADLLHLKEVRRCAVGMASIGGAGTFDGIVLSGIIAAYLA